MTQISNRRRDEIKTQLNLRECRYSVGMTQVELSKAMGVTQSTIASWESGRVYPSAEKLPLLADQLHCTIDRLFGREATG